MDNETYDQINLDKDIIGDQWQYLKEGQEIQIMIHNGRPISLVIPPSVELKIISAPPGIKGNTASNVTKPATVETGATINVPLFIDEGEIIRVDTRSGAYLERAKK